MIMDLMMNIIMMHWSVVWTRENYHVFCVGFETTTGWMKGGQRSRSGGGWDRGRNRWSQDGSYAFFSRTQEATPLHPVLQEHPIHQNHPRDPKSSRTWTEIVWAPSERKIFHPISTYRCCNMFQGCQKMIVFNWFAMVFTGFSNGVQWVWFVWQKVSIVSNVFFSPLFCWYVMVLNSSN